MLIQARKNLDTFFIHVMVLDVSQSKIKKKKIIQEHILEGIREFKKQEKVGRVEILSSREIFKRMISFLKENCDFKYTEIRNFFEIPRGTMDLLKIK